MFNIHWHGICYECGCPLCIVCHVYEEDILKFIRDFTTWVYMNPFQIGFNCMYYKFYGTTVHRICASCYFFPVRVNLQQREIGKKLPTQHKRFSKTMFEIYWYFFRFQEFRQSKDLENCIVEVEKRRYLTGLEFWWEPGSGLRYMIDM